MLLHVVMWRLVDRNDAGPLRERLLGLAGCVPGLLSIEVGVSLEPDVADGADVVLVSRFQDAKALAAYIEHPAHRAVGDWLRPRRSERRVVDCRP
ncbi:MAG TPA: stress responsive protein [Gammaproteobacteria bacterium]|nr:stress responsive protein [Gammaproteobacteria bacterium]